jgi:hypothetical protein
MKSIFTLLLSSLFSISLLAYDGTRLTVSSAANVKMQVEIDGRKYNLDKNGLSIRDLSAGHHSIKIYRDGAKNNSIFSRYRQVLVHSQNFNLKRDHHLDITINRFGKVMMDERRIDRNDDWYDDDDNYDRDNNRWEDRGDNRRAISAAEFRSVQESLKKEWMEASRVTMAKQIIDRNLFTSDQVRTMLGLFTFENSKLDLAKYAYVKTTDKRNYHVLNSVFTYSSSRDELARYIRDYR